MKTKKIKISSEKDVHFKDFDKKSLKGNHRKMLESDINKDSFEVITPLEHAALHNITPRTKKIEPNKAKLLQLIRLRDREMQILFSRNNQIKGFRRIKEPVPKEWVNDMEIIKDRIKIYEKSIKKDIDIHNYIAWGWLKNIKGISYVTAAKLIAHVDPKNFPTVSKLWRYCGLDATHIKRHRGMTQKDAKMCGSPYVKKELLGIMGPNFIRSKSEFKHIYNRVKPEQLKRFEAENHPKKSIKMHAHRRAIRVMVKEFMKQYWINVRRLEGLPTSQNNFHI